MISERGIRLIKKHEGFEPTMYSDPVGNPTIGYGTLLDPAEQVQYGTQRISKDEAEKLLRDHLEKNVAPVIEKVRTDLNQNQRDALTSLIYNIGGGAFERSRLRRAIQRGAPEEKVRRLWMQWDQADGMTLEGLKKRREEEVDLFFKDPAKTFIADNKAIIGILAVLSILFILYRYGGNDSG